MIFFLNRNYEYETKKNEITGKEWNDCFHKILSQEFNSKRKTNRKLKNIRFLSIVSLNSVKFIGRFDWLPQLNASVRDLCFEQIKLFSISSKVSLYTKRKFCHMVNIYGLCVCVCVSMYVDRFCFKVIIFLIKFCVVFFQFQRELQIICIYSCFWWLCFFVKKFDSIQFCLCICSIYFFIFYFDKDIVCCCCVVHFDNQLKKICLTDMCVILLL